MMPVKYMQTKKTNNGDEHKNISCKVAKPDAALPCAKKKLQHAGDQGCMFFPEQLMARFNFYNLYHRFGPAAEIRSMFCENDPVVTAK
jgi:hypothetical protein